MKQTLLILMAVALVGCGGDPNKKANELYVEAVQLISSAERKITPYDSPISDVRSSWEGLKEYEQALDNLQKILDDYSESDLAVKLISGEILTAKKSLEAIEARVSKLKKEVVVPNNIKALLAIQSACCEALGKSKRAKLTEADYERITRLTLDNDQITDISVLLLCTNLERLTLKNTQIKKLTTLTKLKSLRTLVLINNPYLIRRKGQSRKDGTYLQWPAEVVNLRRSLPACRIFGGDFQKTLKKEAREREAREREAREREAREKKAPEKAGGGKVPSKSEKVPPNKGS